MPSATTTVPLFHGAPPLFGCHSRTNLAGPRHRRPAVPTFHRRARMTPLASTHRCRYSSSTDQGGDHLDIFVTERGIDRETQHPI